MWEAIILPTIHNNENVYIMIMFSLFSGLNGSPQKDTSMSNISNLGMLSWLEENILADGIKDLEKRRPSLINQSNGMCIYKRHTEEGHGRRRKCEDGGRDWSEVVTSQGMPGFTGSYPKLRER